MVDILKIEFEAVADRGPACHLAIARDQRLQTTYRQWRATAEYAENMLGQQM